MERLIRRITGGVAERRFLSLRERMERRCDALMDAHPQVPGVQWAVVHRARVVASGCRGVADAATGEPLTDAHLVQACSNGKPVVAAATLLLADRGAIDLDAPVWQYARLWRLSGTQARGHDVDAITLRTLLSHTSGLSVHRYPQLPWDAARVPSAAEILEGYLGDEFSATLLHAAGERCTYSAAGYMLAQLALEEVTGSSLAKLVRDVMGRPMRAMGIRFGRDDALGVPLAERHDEVGARLDRTFYPALAPSGLITTAIDLARFYSGVGRLLGPTRLAEALRPNLEINPGWKFGLGFVLGDRDGYKVCHHAGWSDGMWGSGQGLPALDVGMAVLTNSPAGKPIVIGMLGSAAAWFTREHGPASGT